jgi:hypothetical protein
LKDTNGEIVRLKGIGGSVNMTAQDVRGIVGDVPWATLVLVAITVVSVSIAISVMPLDQGQGQIIRVGDCEVDNLEDWIEVDNGVWLLPINSGEALTS